MKRGSKFDPERAARIVAHAMIVGDKRAAAENGVSVRSLRNWRARLERDAQFAAKFRETKAAVEHDWAESLPEAIRKSIGFLERAADAADVTDPDVVHSIAGALKILTDVATTRRVLDARLARQTRPDGAPARPDVQPSGSAGEQRPPIN